MTAEQRVGKQGTPFKRPRVEDILRSRRLLKRRLQYQGIQLRAQGQVIGLLKEKYEIPAVVERLQRDLEAMKNQVAFAHQEAMELHAQVATYQQRVHKLLHESGQCRCTTTVQTDAKEL